LDYQARGVLYLPEIARFSNLVRLPEGTDIGKAINEAMSAIEAENEELRGVLPTGTYTKLDNSTLRTLLKTFNIDQTTLDGESLFQGDAFGRIYEYFLGNFARAEGQKGGEFFTPVSLVRLIVEVIEPTTAASTIRPADRGACLCRAPASSRTTRRIREATSPSTARIR
jgi:type I restriction enzyme M protein